MDLSMFSPWGARQASPQQFDSLEKDMSKSPVDACHAWRFQSLGKNDNSNCVAT